MATMMRGTSAALAATISRERASCSGVTHLSSRSSRMPFRCRPDMIVRPKVASQSTRGGCCREIHELAAAVAAAGKAGRLAGGLVQPLAPVAIRFAGRFILPYAVAEDQHGFIGGNAHIGFKKRAKCGVKVGHGSSSSRFIQDRGYVHTTEFKKLKSVRVIASGRTV